MRLQEGKRRAIIPCARVFIVVGIEPLAQLPGAFLHLCDSLLDLGGRFAIDAGFVTTPMTIDQRRVGPARRRSGRAARHKRRIPPIDLGSNLINRLPDLGCAGPGYPHELYVALSDDQSA